jgi:hypothetical protein
VRAVVRCLHSELACYVLCHEVKHAVPQRQQSVSVVVVDTGLFGGLCTLVPVPYFTLSMMNAAPALLICCRVGDATESLYAAGRVK